MSHFQYQYHERQCSSEEKFYLNGTLPKRLIDEEMIEPTHARRNAPSIVARLMGVDTLPLHAKCSVNAKDGWKKNSRKNTGENNEVEKHSNIFSPPRTKHIEEVRYDSLPHGFKRDPDYCYNNLTLTELKPREHPQEEQLQKFQKEFEAWKASKTSGWECSSSPEVENSPRQAKKSHTPSQDNFYGETIPNYVDSRRSASHLDTGHNFPNLFSSKLQVDGLKHHEYKSKQRNMSKSCDFAQFPLMNRDEKCGRADSCTKIVLLKPGLENNDESKKFCIGSPEAVKDGSGTVEFLNKVKRRLEFELKGNVKKEPTVTALSERQTDPKEIAQLIAKKVRESVMREIKTNLLQSKSTRLYGSGDHLYEPGSPEFMNKEKKKSLSERLRNVLVSETNVDIPFLINKSSLFSLVDSNEERLMTTRDAQMDPYKMTQCGNMREDCGVEIRSFRHEHDEDDSFGSTEVSMRSPIRSSSASLSGTSLRKLLSDKSGALGSAYIRMRRETTEDAPLEERKASKHKTGFRGKVSNLRYSFNLRGKLFGRKLHSVQDLKDDEFDIMKAFMTEPSVMRNFGYAQDNSTEVPPSPASVCSSPHREFSRTGDYSSLVSTLEVPSLEYDSMPQVFRGINSNPHEPRGKLDQLQCSISQELVIKEEPSVVNVVDSEGEAQSYIRDVLVAASFYDDASKLTSPIQSKVFEEVESAYKRNGKESNGYVKDCSGRNIDHKLLFDLLNETLSAVTIPPVNNFRSRSMRGLATPTVVPNGKKLLDHVCRMIHTYLCPPDDESHLFDDTAAHDLARTPWSDMKQGETDEIGKEIECVLMRELVEEIMKDMCEMCAS